jgi:hypothetical protein
MSRARVAWGYDAIGGAIDRTAEEAKWLAKTGRIRVRKHGHRTVSALVDHLLEDVAGESQKKEEEVEEPP